MKNIHLLPTNKPSRLFLNKVNNKLLIDNDCTLKEVLPSGLYQNIYITSDEEIKEGDRDFYILANDRDGTWINRVEKVIECKIDPNHGKVLILSSGFIYIDEGCKIILTTDPDLIEDGVQAIDDEFLEWFVKNPSCEFIKTKLVYDYEEHPELVGNPKEEWSYYKIIIPQEEPKQETPEEAAQKQWGNVHRTGVLGFIEGANWQAERMYSEEECYRTLHKLMMEIHLSGLVINDDMDLKKWFEQFKKK
jgi:hypothetical protein